MWSWYGGATAICVDDKRGLVYAAGYDGELHAIADGKIATRGGCLCFGILEKCAVSGCEIFCLIAEKNPACAYSLCNKTNRDKVTCK